MIKRLHILLVRMSALMGVYSVLRLGFWLYHRETYVGHSAATLAESFAHGMRFDLAALCWINAGFLLVSFIPKVPRIAERALFMGVNGAFVIVSCNDFELFSFNGKRLSREFFVSVGKDFWQQLPQVFLHYWYLPVAGIVAGVLLWIADERLGRRVRERALPWWAAVVVGTVLSVMFFVGIRGGLQNKSIHVQSAFVQGANELGHLTLNTPYHFLRTFNVPVPPRRAWVSEEELVSGIERLSPGSGVQGKSRDNVVLLILESFSLESYEEGYAPFLRELAAKGLSFPRNFANGRRSIEVLSSLIDGVPSVQDVPFSKSSAQGMALEGAGTRLRAAGYSSAFFHGASRGSMGFDAYTLAHGFQRYHAREDYDGPAQDFDGNWGIYDGPWLNYSLREMGRLKPPFFAGVFTLSSHQPYAIPKVWQNIFKRGTLEIHESIGYTDRMLREFFAKASKEAWYRDTLFIITADHTQKLGSPKFLNSLGAYRVPLILYHPTARLPVVDKTTQHVDVPATILDWVDVPATGLNFAGESVWANGAGKALLYLQPGWLYVRGKRVLEWREDAAGEEFVWNPQDGSRAVAPESGLVLEAKVLIQYLMNGLRDGRWPVVRRE